MAATHPVGLIKSVNGNLKQQRRWVLVTGLAPPSRLGVFNNTVENGYRAFAERYFRCKVGDEFEPALGTSDAEWRHDPLMRQFCEELTGHLDLAPKISVREVVDCYKGTKYKTYLQAAERYWRDGVKRMDAQLRSFVKFEKCDLTKAPRVINPRSPIFNLKLGQFLKKNEHCYFEAIAAVFKQDHVVIKGMDSHASAEAIESMWDAVKDAIGIGGDASKFDMHVSREALMFEHLCYLRPLVNSYEEAVEAQETGDRRFSNGEELDESWSDIEQLAWLLAAQLDNSGKAYFRDGSLRFRMRGTRASGDLNTSLGNCILMCAMTYCWQRRCGVTVQLANNGDDCMYILERRDEQRWRSGLEEFYRAKGFRMVLEDTVDELEQVEFCQSRPVRTIEGLTMVRNPKTLVTKGSMCLLPVDNMRVLRKWMMAIGVAEGSLARGVPVLQSFAKAMRRNGERCTQRLIKAAYSQSNRMYHSDMVVKDQIITAEARVSFYMAWGITPAEQRALEGHYDHWQCSRNFGGTIRSFEAIDRDVAPIAPITEIF